MTQWYDSVTGKPTGLSNPDRTTVKPGPGPITCPECGSTAWTRTVQYIATERQTLAFAGEGTPVYGFEETNADNLDTVDDWECYNGHPADDDTGDLFFEYI